VKVSISDAAAKTVIVPVAGDELLALGELELLEQPATATAMTPAATTAKRRTMHSYGWVSRREISGRRGSR
jgi:hypothetical protein